MGEREHGELFGQQMWEWLEDNDLLPSPREEPLEEASHWAARIADREQNNEQGDK